MADSEIVSHTVLNIKRDDMYDLDQFLISAELALDIDHYASVAKTAQGGRTQPPFKRMPFQQFMMLDGLFAMIDRSGLSEHWLQILMHLKGQLGYDWLTNKKAYLLRELFSVPVKGHNVRRRMGKSVAIHAELSRNLAFFPCAGLKFLYTVHTAPAASECHDSVVKAVSRFITVFNKVQKEKFQQRIAGRKGSADPGDFYYQAKHHALSNPLKITVVFHKMNRNGDCNGGQAISENTLLCKAYTQTNVSVLLFFFNDLLRLNHRISCQ